MFDSSLSSPRTYTIPVSVLRMSALVKKLRALRGWSRIELALRAGVSLADVSVVEDCRPTTKENYERRVASLSTAFRVPLTDLTRRQSSAVILPFTRTPPLTPVAVNTFVLSDSLFVRAVEVHTQRYNMLTVDKMRSLIGRTMRPGMYHELQSRTARAHQVPKGHLWHKYQSIVNQANRDGTASLEYNLPLRDDPDTIISRRVTATKLERGLFEVTTDISGCQSRMKVACDGGEFCTCSNCSDAAVRRWINELGLDAQRYA